MEVKKQFIEIGDIVHKHTPNPPPQLIIDLQRYIEKAVNEANQDALKADLCKIKSKPKEHGLLWEHFCETHACLWCSYHLPQTCPERGNKEVEKCD